MIQNSKEPIYLAPALENCKKVLINRSRLKDWLRTLVTDLVPSEIACFESSPGRIRRTAVWISREEMVDFLEYAANSIPSIRILSIHKVKIMRTGGLSGDTLENIIDKGVQNCHCLVRNTGVRVHLLQH